MKMCIGDIFKVQYLRFFAAMSERRSFVERGQDAFKDPVLISGESILPRKFATARNL